MRHLSRRLAPDEAQLYSPIKVLSAIPGLVGTNRWNAVSRLYRYHRVLIMSQCEWILYESGHKFFMKASQILYAFVLLNMGLKSQTAVSEHLEAGKHFIFI